MRSWTTKPDRYEISWGGCVSTDLRPWNAVKYWTSYYSAKNEPYINEEFDQVFDEANFGTNRFEEGVRLNDVAKMENLLVEPAVIIPVIETVDKLSLIHIYHRRSRSGGDEKGNCVLQRGTGKIMERKPAGDEHGVLSASVFYVCG